MDLGIFIKGRLIGTKQDFEINKKTGQRYDFTALGIDIPFVNSFGQQTQLTKTIRIGTDKLNDAAFMKSLEDNLFAVVEVEIGVGQFQKLFVTKRAVLNVLEPAQQQAS